MRSIDRSEVVAVLLAQIEGFIEIARQGNMRTRSAGPLDQPAGAHRPAPGA